jgi:hypothetical protein
MSGQQGAIQRTSTVPLMQQSYARTPQQILEPVSLEELVEDALSIHQAALGRHSVHGGRELTHAPPVLTEKHKVLMILVNLISNAKYALAAVPKEERRLTVKLGHPVAGHVHIEVRDNGMGIAPELLTRIFQHGGWNGFETLWRLREVAPSLPVVLCSAYSDYSWEEFIRGFGGAHALAELRKPFNKQQLHQLALALSGAQGTSLRG